MGELSKGMAKSLLLLNFKLLNMQTWKSIKKTKKVKTTVAHPHHFDADPNPSFHLHANLDPSFQIKAQNLKRELKWTHFIRYILAGHLQTDADPEHR